MTTTNKAADYENDVRERWGAWLARHPGAAERIAASMSRGAKQRAEDVVTECWNAAMAGVDRLDMMRPAGDA